MVPKIAKNRKTGQYFEVSDEEAEMLTSVEKLRSMMFNLGYNHTPKMSNYGFQQIAIHLSFGEATGESVIKGEWDIFPDTAAGWILYGDPNGRLDD